MPGLVLTRRSFERCDSAKTREGGFVAASARVRPRDEDLRGDECADTGLVQQGGTNLAHDGKHRLFELSALDRQLPDPCRGASQGELCGGVLRIRRGVRTQSNASIDELPKRVSPELLTKVNRGRDDERLQDVDRSNARKLRRITGNDEGA